MFRDTGVFYLSKLHLEKEDCSFRPSELRPKGFVSESRSFPLEARGVWYVIFSTFQKPSALNKVPNLLSVVLLWVVIVAKRVPTSRLGLIFNEFSFVFQQLYGKTIGKTHTFKC